MIMKLNRFEQKFMKMIGFCSKKIKKAGVTGEIEVNTYANVLTGIGLLSSLIVNPFMTLNKITILLFVVSSSLMCAGLLMKTIIFLEKWSRNNQSQKESRETINDTQGQDKIDKNELMFTREALEKEMNN